MRNGIVLMEEHFAFFKCCPTTPRPLHRDRSAVNALKIEKFHTKRF